MTASRSPAPVTGIARALVLTALMGIAQAVPPGWAENILQITDFRITARMEEIADAVAGEEAGLNVFCTLDADQLAEQIPEGYTLKSRFSFWFPNGSAGTVTVPAGGSTGWTDEPIWWYYGACSFSGIGVQQVRVRAEVRVLNPQGAQVLELAAEETAAINIYRPDILLEGGGNEFMDETTEEARGSYFTPGKVKRCRLTFEGVPPDDPNFRVGLQASRVVVYTDSACTIPLQECQWTLAGMPSGDLYVKAGDTCSSTNRGDAVQMTAGIHWPSVEYPLEWRGGGDSAGLTVFSIDLDWEEMDETTEKTPGMYLPLNDDDDNGNEVPDKEESPVDDENDLRVLVVRRPLPPDLPGSLELISSGNTDFWEPGGAGVEKELRAATTVEIADIPQNGRRIMVEGITRSESLRDVSLTLFHTALDSTPTSHTVLASAIEFRVSTGSESICAGGALSSSPVCATTVTSRLTPPIQSQTMTVTVAGNRIRDYDEGQVFANVAVESSATFGEGTDTETHVETDDEGKAEVVLRSGNYGSNTYREYIEFSTTVRAAFQTLSKTLDVISYAPTLSADVFLDTCTEEPLDELPADGHSQALNKLRVSYGGIPFQDHLIVWSFNFWTWSKLNAESQRKFGLDFSDLPPSLSDEILADTVPDFSGDNSALYGSIFPISSRSDATGLDTSIYRAGSVGGLVQIRAANTTILIPHTTNVSFVVDDILVTAFSRSRNVRVFFPDSPELGALTKSFVKSRFVCSGFLDAARYEDDVSTRIGLRGRCEFNVFVSPEEGRFLGINIFGRNRGDNTITLYPKAFYRVFPEDDASTHCKRVGYVIAHEMGHCFPDDDHHDGCLKHRYPQVLLEDCASFCHGNTAQVQTWDVSPPYGEAGCKVRDCVEDWLNLLR